jgi:hypothetical protein
MLIIPLGEGGAALDAVAPAIASASVARSNVPVQ